MTIAESHALAVAVEERRAHLVRCIEMYQDRATKARDVEGILHWANLAAEYRARLAELDYVIEQARTAIPEGEARALSGNR